jgi:Tfp pilus assembly protein PilE
VTARGLGLVSLLVALALVGALWAMNARQNGPTSQSAQRMETQAEGVSADMNFLGAATALEAYRAENATYAGATLPASFHVQVARADASSYCLQATTTSGIVHVVGPNGGAPASGAC